MLKPSQQYLRKKMPLEAAVSYLADVENLILGMSVAMPPGLIVAIASWLKTVDRAPLRLYYMHGSEVLKQHLLLPELADKIIPLPLFLSQHDRQAFINAGPKQRQSVIPANFHQVGRVLTEHIRPDCFMTTVSSMDRHGYFSLGTNADYAASVIRKAHKVIVEVNRFMPRTFGECSVHISEIDALVENDQPLPEALPQPASPTDLQIARLIAQRIDDGDTLQVGVGAVPNAVLDMLRNHKNLGLHSELFSPPMVTLIESGVLNGQAKSLMQHKHVFTLAIGDRAMYTFMDDNPSIVGYPASWVNDPGVIRKNRNMVSVNSAIEVDLTGQINSEQIDGHPFSGTGGQLDFVRGAYAAENGRSFIALHSTARSGSVSRIVPQIRGGVVTDTRMDTQFVVTEFGCVNLKGLSIAQRARALIDLASPAFRESLEQEAIRLGYIQAKWRV